MRVGTFETGRGEGRAWRLSARVDDEPLWFECRTHALAPRPEALASALLVAAAHRGEPVEMTEPVDPVFLAAIPQLLDMVHEWWPIPGTRLVAETAPASDARAAGACAQFFSGGVDSFFTLLGSEPKPDYLVFMHGFDIALDDEARLQAFLPGLKEIAAAHGAEPVVVKTNIRVHPCVRDTPWVREHGGALAAVGHVLSDHFGKVTVPPSYPYYAERPWGTRWDLDPLWSSSRLVLEHGDAPFRRPSKVRAIADDELAMRHLRVCWDQRVATGNCSRCPKCVRTMLCLAACGALDRCEAFDRSVPLEALIDEIEFIGPNKFPAYEEMLGELADPEHHAAIQRLLDRSRARVDRRRRREAELRGQRGARWRGRIRRLLRGERIEKG